MWPNQFSCWGKLKTSIPHKIMLWCLFYMTHQGNPIISGVGACACQSSPDGASFLMQVVARDCSCGGEMLRLKMTYSILQLGVLSLIEISAVDEWLINLWKRQILFYSLVCRQWHSLISRPGFLQHRKLYWRYRSTLPPCIFMTLLKVSENGFY